MDNLTIDPASAEKNFLNTKSAGEQTKDAQMEKMASAENGDSLNGTDLFSLFTADIIREKALFIR